MLSVNCTVSDLSVWLVAFNMFDAISIASLPSDIVWFCFVYACAQVPTTVIPKISINAKTLRDGDIEIPSWRTGLRKTGSTSTVLDKINEDDRNLPRSASSPRLAEENKKNEQNVSSQSLFFEQWNYVQIR